MKLFLLVISLFALAFGQDLIPVTEDRCAAIKGKLDCDATAMQANPLLSCHWCATPAVGADAGFCRTTGLTCDCGSSAAPGCNLDAKPKLFCDAASTVAIEVQCDPKTCQWAKLSTACSNTPPPPTTCCNTVELQQAIACANGVTLRSTCDETTCTIQRPVCPDCNLCANVAKPADYVTFPCQSTTQPEGGYKCNTAKCSWDYIPCPTGDGCPVDKPYNPCLIAPCSSITQFRDGVATKENYYCGECACRCKDANGVAMDCKPANLPPPPPPPPTCGEADCLKTAAYPTRDCPAVAGVAVKSLSYCRRNIDGVCSWSEPLCPTPIDPVEPAPPPPATPCTVVIDTTTNTPTCGGVPRPSGDLRVCDNLQPREYKCAPFSVSSGSNDASSTGAIRIDGCSWVSSDCPAPPPPAPTDPPKPVCSWGGLCGQTCALANDASVAAFNPDGCRQNTVNPCEDKCKALYRGTCVWRDTACFAGEPTGNIQACIAECKGVTAPPPPPVKCGGGLCDCAVGASCYFCNQKFVDESGNSRVFGTCLSTAYPDACAAFGGDSFLTKPDQCSAVTPVKVPPVLQSFADKLGGLTREGLIGEIEKLISSVPEAKDFLFSVRDPTPPTSDSTQVKVEVVIDINGPNDASADLKRKFCDSILRPAAEKLIGAPIKACNIEKITPAPTTKKRQTSSDGTNVVTFSGDGSQSQTSGNPNPNNNNTSSGSVIVASLTAILALFALLF